VFSMDGTFTLDKWESLRREVVSDSDLVFRVNHLTPEGKRLWIQRCRARLQSGEPIDCLGWRALVDVRRDRAGTPDGVPPVGLK